MRTGREMLDPGQETSDSGEETLGPTVLIGGRAVAGGRVPVW